MAGEEVEVSLEVQMDPATKKILSNPDKCRSALLDVTVVKPKETYTGHKTDILRADQVRKLIASLEKERREKQKLLDNLKHDDTIIQIRKHDRPGRYYPNYKNYISTKSPVDDLERKDFIGIGESVEPLFCQIRRSLRNVETRIHNMQDIDLVVSQTTVEEQSSHRRKDYGAHLKNPYCYRADKEYRKTDINPTKQRQQPHRSGRKCFCENCGIIGLLTESQKHPLMSELRESPPPEALSRQETHYNTKLTPQYTQEMGAIHIKLLNNKIRDLEERLMIQEERAVPKEYFKTLMTKMVNSLSPQAFRVKSSTSVSFKDHAEVNKNKRSNSRGRRPYDQEVNCFRAEMQYDAKETPPKEKKRPDHPCAEDEMYGAGGNLWRWGEEILRPGIDLKNRIVTLISDVLSKLTIIEKCTAEKPKEQATSRSHSPKGGVHYSPQVYNMDTKQNSGKEKPEDGRSRHRDLTEKMSKLRDMNFSYGNTKKEDNGPVPKSGKHEFFKIIAKAKNSQKGVLWTNIWNQAKANGQTKDDKIKIKIPSQDGRHVLETEMSIREVEEALCP